jgi:hypothetical protein
MSVIPVLKRLRKRDGKLEASLEYIVRASSKNKTKLVRSSTKFIIESNERHKKQSKTKKAKQAHKKRGSRPAFSTCLGPMRGIVRIFYPLKVPG